MFAILALIAFAAAWFEHLGKVSVSWDGVDQTGLLYLGLAFLAVHLIKRAGGPGNWRSG